MIGEGIGVSAASQGGAAGGWDELLRWLLQCRETPSLLGGEQPPGCNLSWIRFAHKSPGA